RLAIVLLAQTNVGRVSRLLTVNHHIAVQVRGSLDLGEHASVAAIEAVPQVPHDVDEALRALDEAIDGFAPERPTQYELTTAKPSVHGRLLRDKLRAGGRADSRMRISTIEAVMRAADEASADDVRTTVKKLFDRDHRVIVTTMPDR